MMLVQDFLLINLLYKVCIELNEMFGSFFIYQEKSILSRLNNPDIFKIYKTHKNGKYNWYRIYIRNFTIFYTLKSNTMIVAHIFYSRRDINKLI